MGAKSTKKKRSWLDTIEVLGNKLPDISILFLYAIFIVWGLSFALSFVHFSYINPVTHKEIEIVNMLHASELLGLLKSMVKNYASFPPLGLVVVVTLGVGLAEGSGFLRTALKKGLSHSNARYLTPMVVFVSVLSNIASDSAYVILMPLASLVFYTCGRHPLAGIAASFAGLAGGFSASYTPTPMDPLIQGFTQGAANLLDPDYTVNILCNYFFSFSCTFSVILVCWFVTDRIIEPRLNAHMPVKISKEDEEELSLSGMISPAENRAFKVASLVLLAALALLFVLAYPEGSLLRSPSGSLTSRDAPIMQSLVALIFLFFAIPGLVFGFSSGSFKSSKDVANAMIKVVKILSGFLVFSFFCAQFLYIFARSNLGTLIAISGADFLKSMHTPPEVTILGIIILTSCLNIIITSASSKWAILAPIFVPMLMAVGIAPELTQASFRLSDAAMNVSTPMFVFYPLIIGYCRMYCKETGVGTLSSMMIPYTIGLLASSTIMLYVFWSFGLPLGLDSSYTYPRTS